MIFFFNSNGNLINYVPEEVYQSSNGANTLYIVAPLSSANQVLAYFTLPNGKVVSPVYAKNSSGLTLLDTLDINGITYSVWNVVLSDVITAMAGQVNVQFAFINGAQKIRTQSTNFTVSKGASPYEPIDITNKTTLEDLLVNISTFINDSNNRIDEFENEVNEQFNGLEDELNKKVDKAIEEGISNYDAVINKPIINANLIELTGPQIGYYRHTGESKQNFENGCIYYYNGTIFSKLATNKYVDDRFNGANKAVSFVNYSSMITSLNALDNTAYDVGQNIMIVTLNVPDLWVSEITEQSVAYTYVSDTDFINQLNTNGYVQVGYYNLSALETQKVDLSEYAKLEALDTKVDKVTATTQFRQAYIKNIDGSQMMLNIGHYNRNGAIPQYAPATSEYVGTSDDGGTFGVTMPQQPYQAANKKYIDDIADAKVDKWTGLAGNYRLYGVDANGQTQVMYNTNSGNYLSFVARWGSAAGGTTDNGGYLTTSSPKNPYHAANKEYTDEKIANVKPKLYRRELYIAQETYDENGMITSAIEYHISSASSTSDTIVTYSDYTNNETAIKELVNLVRAKYKYSLLFVGDAYQSFEHTTILGDLMVMNERLSLWSAMGMNNWEIDITQPFTIRETITEI